MDNKIKSTLICSVCNKENRNIAKYCRFCGKNINKENNIMKYKYLFNITNFLEIEVESDSMKDGYRKSMMTLLDFEKEKNVKFGLLIQYKCNNISLSDPKNRIKYFSQIYKEICDIYQEHIRKQRSEELEHIHKLLLEEELSNQDDQQVTYNNQ